SSDGEIEAAVAVEVAEIDGQRSEGCRSQIRCRAARVSRDLVIEGLCWRLSEIPARGTSAAVDRHNRASGACVLLHKPGVHAWCSTVTYDTSVAVEVFGEERILGGA